MSRGAPVEKEIQLIHQCKLYSKEQFILRIGMEGGKEREFLLRWRMS